MDNITIRPVDAFNARDAARWDAFVEQTPGTSFFHYAAWMRVIRDAYGMRPSYLLASIQEQVVGILPIIVMRTGLFHRALVSMPFADYGGICAETEATRQALLAEAIRLMQRYGAQYLELRQMTLSSDVDAERVDKVDMLLDLSPGTDGLWQSFPSNVRNHVRKALKSGLKAEFGGGELLDDFYGVFEVNMRDLGSPVHSKGFFRQIFRYFGDKTKCLILRDGRTPVGGAVCFVYKNTLMVPWSSSRRDYFSKRPNHLLFWEAMQYGCNYGLKLFDFGRSSKDSGTYIFKAQWGAQPVQLHWVYYSRQRLPMSVPSIDSQQHSFVTEVWKTLPVAVTRVVGPWIRKHISN
jgi:FemAB-related protein (PEP-CTERM system-associated)